LVQANGTLGVMVFGSGTQVQPTTAVDNLQERKEFPPPLSPSRRGATSPLIPLREGDKRALLLVYVEPVGRAACTTESRTANRRTEVRPTFITLSPFIRGTRSVADKQTERRGSWCSARATERHCCVTSVHQFRIHRPHASVICPLLPSPDQCYR
jgi:hypothetical protein